MNKVEMLTQVIECPVIGASATITIKKIKIMDSRSGVRVVTDVIHNPVSCSEGAPGCSRWGDETCCPPFLKHAGS